MEFDPTFHTNEYLEENVDIALSLAEYSSDFATSSLANDIDILKLTDGTSWSVGHTLAHHQSEWLKSNASKNIDILGIKNKFGWSIAHVLAEYQSEWLHSNESKNIDVLEIKNKFGSSVAHTLAKHQPDWLHTSAAHNPEILQFSDQNNESVAHLLAQHQPAWLSHKSSENLSILKLATLSGETVAHRLAQQQPEWMKSEAAQSLEILSLAYNSGFTVAHQLVTRHKESLNHQPLMNKKILTLFNAGKMLAEYIGETHRDSVGVKAMAIKLIEQGAAYKHSKNLSVKIGENLLIKVKTLKDDNENPLITLKQLQALYSTFSHNVTKLISSQGEKQSTHHQIWYSFLHQSENLIRQHLDEHPALFDIEHTVDIFCEPADALIKRLQSERNLQVNWGERLEQEYEPSPTQNSIY